MKRKSSRLHYNNIQVDHNNNRNDAQVMCVCVCVTVWEPKIGPIRMVDQTHFWDNRRRRRRRVGNRNQLMTI